LKINGIAHLVISVGDLQKSFSFYQKIFEFLEFELVYHNSKGAYFVGGRTAVGIMQAEKREPHFNQTHIGLHHFCFRAESAEDVDRFHKFLVQIEAKIIRAPEPGSWAPGYYSTLFEDPDGKRLEMNFVPGKGLLGGSSKFNPVGYEP